MFIGIAESYWMVLLSGLLGAIISAILAAFVAWGVVAITMRSQRIESSRDRAAAHETAVRQERSQSAEASTNRLYLATADYISAMKLSFVSFGDRAAVRQSFTQMSAAVLRMRLEVHAKDSAMLDEMDLWTNLVLEISSASAGLTSNLPIESAAAKKVIPLADAALSVLVQTWAKSSFDRDLLAVALMDRRLKLVPEYSAVK